MTKKTITSALALILACVVAVGVVYAWFVTFSSAFLVKTGDVNLDVNFYIQAGETEEDTTKGALTADDLPAGETMPEGYTYKIPEKKTDGEKVEVAIFTRSVRGYLLQLTNNNSEQDASGATVNTSAAPVLVSLNFTKMNAYLYTETTEALDYFLTNGNFPDSYDTVLDSDGMKIRNLITSEQLNTAQLAYAVTNFKVSVVDKDGNAREYPYETVDELGNPVPDKAHFPLGNTMSFLDLADGDWFVKDIPVKAGETLSLSFSLENMTGDLVKYTDEVPEHLADEALAYLQNHGYPTLTKEQVKSFLETYTAMEVAFLDREIDPISVTTSLVVTAVQQPREEYELN